MPTPTPAPFVSGDPMVSADVEAALADARDYLNGQLPGADIEEGGIGYENLLAPVLTGFPHLTFDGEYQGAVWRASGTGDAQGPQNQTVERENNYLAREVERGSIYPVLLEADDTLPLPRCALRFDVDEGGVCDVLFTCKAEPIVNLGVPSPCGILALYYRNTTNDPESAGAKVSGTDRHISYAASTMTHYVITGQFEVSEGVYDVWIGYRKGDADSGVKQIIVSSPTIGVELHKAG